MVEKVPLEAHDHDLLEFDSTLNGVVETLPSYALRCSSEKAP